MEQYDTNNIFYQKDNLATWKEHRFKPCDFLKTVVKEYMILECSENTVLETLPSNSFSLNYILRGHVQLSLPDGSKTDLPKAVSFGITQKFFHFTFSEFAKLFVVIFNPGFASAIIERPLNEFFERFIAIDDFFDKRTNLAMIEGLKKQSSHQEMVRKMESFLIGKLVRKNADTFIYRALLKIHQNKGRITIKDIVRDMPISRDTFEKKFKKLVGTTPKKYAGIIRFRNIFEGTLEKGKLTQIALNAGYYDQSHFIKDFKSCVGKLPSDSL